MATALITGASRGLGKALATALAERGWHLVIDARGSEALTQTAEELSVLTSVTALSGDVTDPRHRRLLAEAAASAGPVDLVVNNASFLGPSPLPTLLGADVAIFEDVLATNVVAPLALLQTLAPHMAPGAAVINVTSDAAVEAYEGWGLYGSSKAALDRLSAVLAAERPGWSVYAFDPGDMRTRMHQDAFPGEDISDRPEPETVVPTMLALLENRPPSGRIVADDVQVGTL